MLKSTSAFYQTRCVNTITSEHLASISHTNNHLAHEYPISHTFLDGGRARNVPKTQESPAGCSVGDLQFFVFVCEKQKSLLLHGPSWQGGVHLGLCWIPEELATLSVLFLRIQALVQISSPRIPLTA